MLKYEEVLPGFEGILYKKDKINGKAKWLYAFRYAKKASQEEHGWLKQASMKEEFYDEDLKKHQQTFGTIILESDLDMEPADVYRAYACRWEIEIVMRYYKTVLGFDDTRVHDDYSVIGPDFMDFIASVLTLRVVKDLDNKKVLEETTYGRAIAVLKRAKKIKLAEASTWQLVRLNPSQEKLLTTLGLLETPKEQSKRKRGRPKRAYSLTHWESCIIIYLIYGVI